MLTFEEVLENRKELISNLYKGLDISKLTKKQVMVRSKDGKIHQATRWVSSDTGKSHKIEHKKYNKHEDEFHGETDQEKIENVLSSDMKQSDKARALLSLGVLDTKEVAKLVGGTLSSSDVKLYHKEIGSNPSDFSANEFLLTSSKGEVSDESIRSSITDIEENLGKKKAFEAQKKLKKQVIEELGITVDDKWESYEASIDRLIRGKLGKKCLLAYGTGGIGKTFTVEKMFGDHNSDDFQADHKMIAYDKELDMVPGGDEYDYIKLGGVIGRKEIQRAMYEHSNKLIIFDDLDSMWDDEGLINVLKNTLDTSGSGKVQFSQPQPGNEKTGLQPVPASFTFTGEMMFITNLTKEALVAKGAAPIVDSRAKSIDLTMSAEQTFERLESICDSIKIKLKNGEPDKSITKKDRKVAFEALSAFSDKIRIDQLNTRVLGGLISDAEYWRSRGLNEEQTMLKVKKEAAMQLGLA